MPNNAPAIHPVASPWPPCKAPRLQSSDQEPWHVNNALYLFKYEY